jgi:hypothetical protein
MARPKSEGFVRRDEARKRQRKAADPNAWAKKKPAPQKTLGPSTPARQKSTAQAQRRRSIKLVRRGYDTFSKPVMPKQKPGKRVRLKTIPGPIVVKGKQSEKIIRTQLKSMGMRPEDYGTDRYYRALSRATRSKDPYKRIAAYQLATASYDVDKEKAKLAKRRAGVHQARQGKIPNGLAPATILAKTGALEKVGSAFAPYAVNLKNSREEIARMPSGVAKVGMNAVADAIELPAALVTSTYMAADAGASALTGDTRKVKQMYAGFKESDPFALLAQGRVDEALKAAEKNPLNTALTAYGVKSGLGKGAGTVMRHSPSKRLRNAASTKRASEQIYGNIAREQGYSPDVIKKGFQVLGERRQAKRLVSPKDKKRGRAEAAQARRQKKEIERDVDETVAVGEGVRRENRDRIIHDHMPSPIKRKVRDSAKPLKHHERKIFGLAVEGTLRRPETITADLENILTKYIETRKVMEVEPNPNLKLLDANAKSIEAVEKAIANGVDGPALFRAVDEYKTAYKVVEDDLIARNVLPETRAAKAREVPYAVAHRGAKEGDIPQGAWIDRRSELNLAEQQAQKAERQLFGQYKVAQSRGNAAESRAARQEWGAAKNAMKTVQAEIRAHNADRPSGRALLDEDGKPLTIDEMQATRAAEGTPEPGFYAQRVNPKFKSAAYVNRHPDRGTVPSQRRTGSATRAGTYDFDHQTVYAHLMRSTGLDDWVRQYDRMLNRYGAADGDGQPIRKANRKEMENFTDSVLGKAMAESQGWPEMVQVRISPFGATNALMDKISQTIMDAGDGSMSDVAAAKGLRGILDASKEGDGPMMLVPKAAWDRLDAHYNPSDGILRTLQSANNMFKSAVLPTSPKWIAGNMLDNAVRLAVSGAGPSDWFVGGKVLKELAKMSPEDAELARVRFIGGMHFGTRSRMNVHRDPSDFNSRVAQMLDEKARSNGAQIAVRPWTAYRDTVFSLNTRLEQQMQRMALGRVARQHVRETTGHWHSGLKLQPKAIEDLANGLRHTNTQIRFAREIRQILGNWNTYGPSARRVLFDVMPFGAWLANALKFVYVTMPTKHPVLTGIAASLDTMTEEERKKIGLAPFADNAKPAFMQGGIPYKDTQINTAGFSSFGFAGGIVDNVASMPFAPFQSPSLALRGVDWKGTKLRKANGDPLDPIEKAAYAAYLALEGMVPLVSITRRVREKGGKSVAGSNALFPQVKKGTEKGYGEAIEKWANPFKPIDPNSGSKPKKPKSPAELQKKLTTGGPSPLDLQKKLAGR